MAETLADLPRVDEATKALALTGGFRQEDFGFNDSLSYLDEVGKVTRTYTRRDAEGLMADFRVEIAKAMTHPTRRSPEDWSRIEKGIAPEISARIPMMGPDAGVAQTLAALRKAIQDMPGVSADVFKDLSMAVPLSSGFVPYDLQAPSKKIFPALSPLRNRIPRTKGQGLVARFKVISGVTGSETGGQADLSPFIGEGPQTSGWGVPSGAAGGLTLARPPRISYTAVDQTFNYKILGLSDSVTWAGEVTSLGYESLRAISSFTLLKAMFIAEEKGLIGGRANALATPTGAPTGASRAAGAGETALSGVTTNIFAKITAVAQFGETASGPASAAIGVAAGQVVDLTIANDVPGALGYRVYVSTGVADPGDASRFFMVFTAWTKITLQGALPTTGATAPALDTGTSTTNHFSGAFEQLDANAVVAKRVNAAPTATMFDNDLITAWVKQKADPTPTAS